MKLIDYFKDKVLSIVISFLTIISILMLLILFNVNILLIIYIPLIIFISYVCIFIYNYFRKVKFYNGIKRSLFELDKKYLITEILERPNFLEGNLFMDYLYEIDKSMNENINDYKYGSEEFKEYIELWCHEIKTPIATSKLIVENNNNKVTKNIEEEIDKIENYVEQVLYFARSENANEDYIVTDVDLKKVVDFVIKRNKKDILNKKIKINIEIDKTIVKSDSKWLEFIINQIVVNSIKYSKDKNSIVSISTKTNKNNTILLIEDNGIGIETDELNKVFDKGFTGSNGRKKYNSTGIGLFLCKKLCLKLNHDIEINSIINEKTIVSIMFPNSSLSNITNLTDL